MSSKVWILSAGVLVAVIALLPISMRQSLEQHSHEIHMVGVPRSLRTIRRLQEEAVVVNILLSLHFVNHELANSFDELLSTTPTPTPTPTNEVVTHFCQSVNEQASGPQVVAASNEIDAVIKTRQFLIGDVVDYECSVRDTNRVYDSDAEDTFGVGFFILELAVEQIVHVTRDVELGPLTSEEVSAVVENGFNRGSGGRVRFRSLLQQNNAFATIVTVEVLEDSLSAPQEAPSASPSSEPTGDPTLDPTVSPSGMPTSSPSGAPTRFPSQVPSSRPSVYPSKQPPSRYPSVQPSGDSLVVDRPSMSPPTSPPTLPDPVSSPIDQGGEQKDNLPLILGAIAGGLTTLLVSCFFILVVWRTCSNDAKGEETDSPDEPKSSAGQDTMTFASSHLEGAMVTCSDDSSSYAKGGFLYSGNPQLESPNDVGTNSFDDNSLFTSPENNDSVTDAADKSLVEAASYESSMILPPSVNQVADFEDDFIVSDEARSTDDDSETSAPPSTEASQSSLFQDSPLDALELSDEENSNPFVDGEDDDLDLFDRDEQGRENRGSSSVSSSYQSESQEDNTSTETGERESISQGQGNGDKSANAPSGEPQQQNGRPERQSNNLLLRNILEDAHFLSRLTSPSIASMPSTRSAPQLMPSPVAGRGTSVGNRVPFHSHPAKGFSSRSVGSPLEPRSFGDAGDKAPHVPNRPVASDKESAAHSASEASASEADGNNFGEELDCKPVESQGGDAVAPYVTEIEGLDIFTAPTPKTENKAAETVVDKRLFDSKENMSPTSTLGAKAIQRVSIPESEDSVIGEYQSDESYWSTVSDKMVPGSVLGNRDEEQHEYDDEKSDGSDGLSNPWLFDTLEQTLGPRSATADLDSMSTGSNRSQRSNTSSVTKPVTPLRRPRSASNSPEETQRSDLEGISSTIEPRSLDNELKRLKQQLTDVDHKGEPDTPIVSSSIASASAAGSSKSGAPSKSMKRSGSKPKKIKRKQVVVVAPPGKVGVVLANHHDGNGTIVSEVLPSSSMHNILSPGDKLVAINGKDVTKLLISDITSMMASLVDTSRRLTIITSVKQVSVPDMFNN